MCESGGDTSNAHCSRTWPRSKLPLPALTLRTTTTMPARLLRLLTEDLICTYIRTYGTYIHACSYVNRPHGDGGVGGGVGNGLRQ